MSGTARQRRPSPDDVPAELREPLAPMPLSEQDVRELEEAAARWPAMQRSLRRAKAAARREQQSESAR